VKHFFFFLVVVALSSCKKSKTPDVILDPIYANYMIGGFTAINLTDNSSGSFDSTVSFAGYVEKQFNNSFYLDHDAVVTCNNKTSFNNISYPSNKLGLFFPTCNYKFISPEFSEINYNDTMSFPYVNTFNWTSFDSINTHQDLNLDLSAFKNHEFLVVALKAKSNPSSFNDGVVEWIYQPFNSVTIDSLRLKSLFSYYKTGTIEVSAFKSIKTEVSGKKLSVIKKLAVKRHVKAY
jgi:hypothetical protein